jgi:hypothetical protein
MNSNIDHVIWACPDLDSGIEEIEALTGVRPTAGGRHPKLGTHNALMHLGKRSYLEIVAPDPDHDGGPWSRSLQELTEPTLLHWVLARSRLSDYACGLSGLIGGDNEVGSIARQHPTLGELNWEILLFPRHDYGCLVPFLIDWSDSTHPTELLEPRCTLRNVRILSPDLPNMMKITSWLGIDAEFVEASEPKLEFRIDTPKGEVRLATPEPLPIGVTFE